MRLHENEYEDYLGVHGSPCLVREVRVWHSRVTCQDEPVTPSADLECSVPSGDEFKILANVIRVAREELADRELDAIPIRLRNAAKGTGKRLPAPHQKAIIDHIASDEPFRTAVTKRWTESGIDDEVGQRFLRDPTAAATDVSLAAASLTIGRVSAERDDALRVVSDLSTQLAEAKSRLVSAKREHDTALEQQAASDKRSRQGLKRSAEAAGAKLLELERQKAELDAQITDLHQANEALAASVDRMTERTAKRELAAKQRLVQPESQMAGAIPSGASELAALLDAMEIRMRPYREAHRHAGALAPDVRDLKMPAGILPDSAAGLDAVIDQQPDRFLIDGYNVAGAVSDKFSTRDGREAAIARADMLKRATQASVVIVFDASNVKGDDFTISAHGVHIVFEPEVSADDAIVNLVAARADRCVVITDDRELQLRASRTNCLVLYTKALVAWSEHLNER
jgi:hypothetical protein